MRPEVIFSNLFATLKSHPRSQIIPDSLKLSTYLKSHTSSTWHARLCRKEEMLVECLGGKIIESLFKLFKPSSNSTRISDLKKSKQFLWMQNTSNAKKREEKRLEWSWAMPKHRSLQSNQATGSLWVTGCHESSSSRSKSSKDALTNGHDITETVTYSDSDLLKVRLKPDVLFIAHLCFKNVQHSMYTATLLI